MLFLSLNPGYAAAKEGWRRMLIKTNVRGGPHPSIRGGGDKGGYNGLRRHWRLQIIIMSMGGRRHGQEGGTCPPPPQEML